MEHGDAGLVQRVGEAVRVTGRRGREPHALVVHELDDAGSRTNACAMFTPNGLSVRSRILAISSRTSSSRPDDVSMIPSAPAFDTADASCARAM